MFEGCMDRIRRRTHRQRINATDGIHHQRTIESLS
jgi:hypothetical protein